MQDYKLEGVGKINGGEFDTLIVEGVGSCSSNIKARDIHIEGVFNCIGQVDAEYLYCEGVANFKGNIRSRKMYVEGVFSVTENAKIEAAEITCEGVIKTKGEISADSVYAEGCIEADEIVGDSIKIYSRYHISKIINFFNRIKSKVRLIEATTVDLQGVTAITVNGSDITIGPNCTIENIDCNGTLSIDRSSVVRNITGNYTTRE